MMDIDELYSRLDDPDGTFTSAEVTRLLEDTERKALDDIYNKSRIAVATQYAQQGLEITRACAAQMLAQWNSATTPELVAQQREANTPELVEVGE